MRLCPRSIHRTEGPPGGWPGLSSGSPPLGGCQPLEWRMRPVSVHLWGLPAPLLGEKRPQGESAEQLEQAEAGRAVRASDPVLHWERASATPGGLGGEGDCPALCRSRLPAAGGCRGSGCSGFANGYGVNTLGEADFMSQPAGRECGVRKREQAPAHSWAGPPVCPLPKDQAARGRGCHSTPRHRRRGPHPQGLQLSAGPPSFHPSLHPRVALRP